MKKAIKFENPFLTNIYKMCQMVIDINGNIVIAALIV